MGREGKKELIQREVCLKSNLWLVGLQTGRPEWLRSWREEFKGHCVSISTTQQAQAEEDLQLTTRTKLCSTVSFTYTGGSLVGVNRDSRRSVEKQRRKKEKMHHLRRQTVEEKKTEKMVRSGLMPLLRRLIDNARLLLLSLLSH